MNYKVQARLKKNGDWITLREFLEPDPIKTKTKIRRFLFWKWKIAEYEYRDDKEDAARYAQVEYDNISDIYQDIRIIGKICDPYTTYHIWKNGRWIDDRS